MAPYFRDKLDEKPKAHRRIRVVEVMGRYAGWIALNSGIAGTADVILIPEILYVINKVAEKIKEHDKRGRHFSIVVVAERVHPKNGTTVMKDKEIVQAERLGGVGEVVAVELQELTKKETQTVTLEYLLRGGTPSTFDRLIALRLCAAAARALAKRQHDIMVALDPPIVRYFPLEQVTRRIKTVPLDSDIIKTGRELGISFGDYSHTGVEIPQNSLNSTHHTPTQLRFRKYFCTK